ncbi:hypothetical protein B4U79_18902 [Dinothrombium tinctorium]|uniref:RING-type domain-containing protein n=1 Tax=Dinothrombium tinctorium TaxID=1965070 RepID=A0A3S3RE72_9ACAR|nr:hypothetical protein B4U79_18902 [Dinothrombium tinctorium]
MVQNPYNNGIVMSDAIINSDDENEQLYVRNHLVEVECAICSESYLGHFTYVLQCGHSLCSECTIKLRMSTYECPFCKKLIHSLFPFMFFPDQVWIDCVTANAKNEYKFEIVEHENNNFYLNKFKGIVFRVKTNLNGKKITKQARFEDQENNGEFAAIFPNIKRILWIDLY